MSRNNHYLKEVFFKDIIKDNAQNTFVIKRTHIMSMVGNFPKAFSSGRLPYF